MNREQEILDAMAEVDTDKVIEALLDSNELTDLLTAIAKHKNPFMPLTYLEDYADHLMHQLAEKIVQDRHVGEDTQGEDVQSDKDFKGI